MSAEPTPDGLLLRRYRERGDEAAFAELRRRHERLVLATCRRETGDSALAEDAAQGVFLLLIRKSFDDRASLAGWLHGAARLVSRNLIREEDRRQRRERRAFQEFVEPETGWNAASPFVDAALADLKSGDREAVLLRFANDLSLAEVGQFLGVGENAARMRVARALERMQAYLRRAGVGLSALLLASLLSARLADAAALPAIRPPSTRAVRLARRALLQTLAWKPGFVGLLAVVGLGATYRTLALGPPRLDRAETAALFRSAEGRWRGTLEFADDATGARIQTPTTVAVSATPNGLRLVARYAAFSSVDTMTIAARADGRFRIENHGSHDLDGLYELVRLRDGRPAFLGFSPAARGEVRLTVQVRAGGLTLQEDLRRADAYRLRNRFELQRL